MASQQLGGGRLGSVVRRILIVDDHPIVCEGIGKLLAGHGDLEICGSAADVASALLAVKRLGPDVALVDLSLGSSSGLQLIEMLARDSYPTVLTLALSMHDEALYAKRVLQAGGRGYVMKQEGTDVLLHAIRTVLAGEVYVSAAVNASLLRLLSSSIRAPRPSAGAADSDLPELSRRELQVYRLVGQGLSTKAIAQQLYLSVKTVESHRANIRQKLGIESAAALVAHAAEWHVRSSDRPGPLRPETTSQPQLFEPTSDGE
jgi:DNA-binding NarL/FixJ family response regulator